jgi:hypothetical protein
MTVDVTPRHLSLTRESSDRVRLAWQGKAGRLDDVQSTVNLASKHSWMRLMFSAGTGQERALTDPTASGAQRFCRVRRW